MMSWKALRLCFVLLLHSTNFGQSRVLEKDSPSVKKAQQAQAVYRYEATVNGEDLRRRIMQISEDPRAQRYQGMDQFAYIYIQPSGVEGLYFETPDVEKKLKGTPSSASELRNGEVFPTRPPVGTKDNTNFRMAYRGPAPEVPGFNAEHSEYKILTGGGLEIMVNSFIKRTKNCPKYVILYSKNLPCMNLPDSAEKPPRCLEMIGEARENVLTITENYGACSETNTEFYLYTTQNSPRFVNPNDKDRKRKEESSKMFFEKEKKYFIENGIEWIHP